ncbi:hypothetical protein PsYK624_123970 [Phanerochaete sordida]|uniref:Uncharacterized protein n=1 Tax=Phanerochaete sordida TaxID=48140 RepID=A0A9P3GJQ7_9APHY|nr:hypothetical protein PsYK624_123970 [Phanerochaete sordida]
MNTAQKQPPATSRNPRQSCPKPSDLSDAHLNFELATLQEETHASLSALRAHHARELADAHAPLLAVLAAHDAQDLAQQHAVRARVAGMRAAAQRAAAGGEERLREIEAEELARRQQLQAAARARRVALYAALLDAMRDIKDAEYDDARQDMMGNVLFEWRLRRMVPRPARLTSPTEAHSEGPKSYLEAAVAGLRS